MKEKTKIKVKVKKRKLKIKNIIIFAIILVLLILGFIWIKNLPIKNVYVIGNDILSDKEILSISSLDTYPKYLLTSSKKIKNILEKNDYIKQVKVKKRNFSKIYLEITEYKPLCLYNDKLILTSGKQLDNIHYLTDIPTLINYPTLVYDKFISKFSEVDYDVLAQISEIQYDPNEVDDSRFLLYMKDGNYVYITLSKITKLNSYNSIYQEMEGHKGIIYLDSGDYIELKD